MSISLKSAQTGATLDNYNLAVNVTDTTAANNPKYLAASLPTLGFQFDASSLDGAGNGAPVTNYGMIYSYLIPAGGYAANSNIVAHSDSVMGDWAFQYDTLNRLAVAAPALNAPNSPSNYRNTVACFGYDGFGNRTVAAFSPSSDCTRDTTATAAYDVNNHMTSVSQSAPIPSAGPITVDLAGNVTADPLNKYLYDGEGRLCAVQTILTSAATQYTYDASGGRVAKWKMNTWPSSGVCPLPSTSGATLTNEYLLDQGGDQVTELNGSGAWQHSNVWAGAHLDATYDAKGLHFHLADPLGTRRIQTNIDGQVEESCQSLPFGDNLSCTTTALATADDATEHHFTGKERDAESGNDYFFARYYTSALGRFTTPDWSAKVVPVPYAKLDDPQSLNLYAYVENNPLIRTDPDGHGCVTIFGHAFCMGAPPPLPPPPPTPAAPGGPPMKGVNPVTGKTLFSPDPKGIPGNERPGVGGKGSFGAPRDGGRTHHGEDISGPVGTDIHASTSGTVTFSGNMSGYGNTVKVDDGSGTVTLYGHNSENSVSAGDTVKQGQVIGTLGQTGNAAGQPATESHVHFEVHVNGQLVNPATWLNSATNP